jgi:TonB family protein
MMSKNKSPLRRGLRALYLLPLLCLGLVLQSKTVYVPGDGETGSTAISGLMPDGSGTLIILRQPWGDEKEITLEEYNQLDEGKIKSLELLKETAAKEKYGERAANGVIVITLKMPQELNEVVVVRYDDDDGPYPFYLINPDTMPKFQGGDMNDFSRWLNARIAVPKTCKHSGTMKISFVVDSDGSVKDVKIAESVCEELDALMLSLVSSSPKWEPATSNGHAVSQSLSIPVVFQLR